MEKEYRISWLKVIGVLVLIVIVIAILCLVYPRKENKGNMTSSVYVNNITMMKEAGFEYFKGNNLPDKIGESNKISLDEMVTSNLIVEFLDEKGNSCNKTDSYIQATKTLDNEYAMKVFLSCEEKTDYLVTTIANSECTNCNTIDKENDEKDNSSSSNNNNSSNNVADNTNNNSGSSYRPVDKVITINKKYNINYINNCGVCNGSNCGNCTSNIYYTVSFNSNGGTAVRTQTVKSGEKAIYKETIRDGYTFLGWYLDGEKYDFETPVRERITLTAKWKKNIEEDNKNQYTVKFNSNGGTKVPSQTVDEGDKASRPNKPVKECYEFAGWYTDKALTKKYNFNNSVNKDMVLYAKWIDSEACKNSYEVDFETNGGSRVPSEEVTEGDTVNRPKDPTRECYEFVGWYTDRALTKKYDFSKPVNKDMTLYAKWEDDGSCVETHRVRFDSNGGSSVATQTVEDGMRAEEPRAPKRSGYTFLGWYLDGEEFNFRTRIYENITLEAEWEKDEEKYYTYCKINTDRYYSTSYVGADKGTWNYNWTIRFDNIRGSDLEILRTGYITTTTMYNGVYNNYVAGKGISMVGSTGKYDVPITSGAMLKTYSLKSTNFNKYLSDPYYKNGTWYVDASVSIRNYNNLTAYYANNLKSYIYFIPFYFDVQYTDTYDCFSDKASNYSKYEDDYKVVDTFYK